MTKWVLFFCILLIQGCAIHYTDNQGNHRIVGLVDISLPREDFKALEAGDAVSATNVGVLISSGPIHSGVGIGYNSETSVILKDDTAVLLKTSN